MKSFYSVRSVIFAVLAVFIFGFSRISYASVDTDGDGLSDALEVGMTQQKLDSRVGNHATVVHFADGSTTTVTYQGTARPRLGKFHRSTGLLLVDADPSTRTDPKNPDTDGDGYWDGPDVLVNIGGELYWRIGEDKNGNGKYEPNGADGIPGTADDEYDPLDPNSHPNCPHFIPYAEAASWHDADGDGLVDGDEDFNLNGKFEPELGETNFLDADTDDDGLSDGFERGMASSDKLPFISARNNLDPLNPDTDGDGLPDGLELGVKLDANNMPLTLAGAIDPANGTTVSLATYVDGRYTDLDATFTFNGQKRKCFATALQNVAITDPTNSDTNSDGISDGDGVLFTDDNKANYQTNNPGVGMIDYFSSDMSSLFMDSNYPAELQPMKIGNNLDPNNVDEGEYILAFQLPYGTTLSRDNVSISNSNAISLADYPNDITKVDHNIYLIKVVANTNLQSSENCSVSINISGLNCPHTVRLRVLPPYVIPRLTLPQKDNYDNFGVMGYDSWGVYPITSYEMPKYKDTPLNYLTWYDVTPCPLPEHWRAPYMAIAYSELFSMCNDAYGPDRRQNTVESLKNLMTRFYFCDSIQDQLTSNTIETDKIKMAKLERQWLFAVTYAEVNDGTGDIVNQQLYKLLTALTAQTQLRYVYAKPGVKACRVPKSIIRGRRLRDSYRVRLCDVIDSKNDWSHVGRWWGTVPHNKTDYVEYQGNMRSRRGDWRKIMNWRFKDTTRYPDRMIVNIVNQNENAMMTPQWQMKKWNDLRGVFGLGENDMPNTKDGYARVIAALKIAIACKISLQGIMSGTPSSLDRNISEFQSVGKYTYNKYYNSNSRDEYNYHPVSNFTPTNSQGNPWDPPTSKEEFLHYDVNHNPENICGTWFMRYKLNQPAQ